MLKKCWSFLLLYLMILILPKTTWLLYFSIILVRNRLYWGYPLDLSWRIHWSNSFFLQIFFRFYILFGLKNIKRLIFLIDTWFFMRKGQRVRYSFHSFGLIFDSSSSWSWDRLKGEMILRIDGKLLDFHHSRNHTFLFIFLKNDTLFAWNSGPWFFTIFILNIFDTCDRGIYSLFQSAFFCCTSAAVFSLNWYHWTAVFYWSLLPFIPVYLLVLPT